MRLHKYQTYTTYAIAIGTTIILCLSFTSPEQNDDYANDTYLRYDDYIYDDSIKTVLLHPLNNELNYPIIALKSKAKLKLSFDDLRRNSTPYFYSIIHCDANWEPSKLLAMEYIDGFTENEIIDFRFAFNTDLYYTHFNAVFPNENFNITKSGNYIIKVYAQDQSNQPILTKRFMVYDPQVNINTNIHRATDVNEQFFRQEVDFKINHGEYKITNPFDQLNVIILQNFRWDNAISGLKPRFVKDNELDYNYESGNVFDGNNEFRNFDIKSILYQTINIKKIKYNPTDKLVHVDLLDDEVRAYKQYLSMPDINGNFLIKRNEGSESEIEADYVKVRFSLPYDFPFTDGNLYLFGKLSDWKFKEELKLDYDTLNAKYTKEVLLKQGYYNYVYCFVKDGSKNTGDISVIEGSYSETENEYTILVYHRPLNENYDKLIGYYTDRSGNQ